MDIKGFPALIVGVVVALVLAGAVLPVFAETTSATNVLNNREQALYPIEKITPDMEYKLVWDTSTPGYVTINDTDQVEIKPGSIICAVDSFVIRCGTEGTRYYLQSVGGSLSVYVSVANKAGVLTIENNAGTLTITSDFVSDTDVTKTIEFSELYAVYPNGSYVMKSPEQRAFMKEDSEIYALGLTTMDGVWNNAIQIVGNLDSVTVTQVFPDPATYTFDNVSINYSECTNYKDTFLLDSITFDATNISTSNVTPCTYSYFVVPAEITAEKAVHPDGALAVMLNVLPLLAIAGLVTGAVVWFVVRKG